MRLPIKLTVLFLLVIRFPGWADAAEDSLRAGAATADISPGTEVSLDGLLQKHGLIQRVVDPLMVRCVAFDNGKIRLAIVLVDACVISGDIVDRARTEVRRRTGLPEDRLLIAATHTHMAPRIAGWTEREQDRNYYDRVIRRIAESVAQSIENLAPARLGWAVKEKPEFLANRRWFMKPGSIKPNPFGEAGDQVVMGGHPAGDRLKPAGPVDPNFTVVSVEHADGRSLALLANYGIHYGVNQKGVASADYFGHFARRIAEKSAGGTDHRPPMIAIMSNGASADINARGGGFDRMRQLGDALAGDALNLCRKIEHRSQPVLGMAETEIELAVRRPDPQRIAWARKIVGEPASPRGSSHRWTRIFAEETLHLAKFPPTVPVKLQVVRLGDLGIVAIPGEVFAATGLALRRDRPDPLKTTMTISHANGWHGYIPPPDQHDLGGMEVWPRRASYLEKTAPVRIRGAVEELWESILASD